jgi:GT2 family glycosyltransferase
MPKKTVSVIIPTMQGREAMLDKLISTIPKEYQILTSSNPSLLLAGKRNIGASCAKNDYLLFIDDDNYLEDDAIEKMLNRMNESIGVMGMTACYHNKKRRIADGGSMRNYLTGFTWGVNTNKPLNQVDGVIYEVDEVANSFMIKRSLFEELGGFDEENFPIDLDEADLCKRLKDKGYRIVMNPTAICYHDSQTYSHVPDFRRPMNAYFMARNRILFQRKHLSNRSLLVYFLFFFPVFYLSYIACLILRRKPMMCIHFTKGIIDGISGHKENKYQQK